MKRRNNKNNARNMTALIGAYFVANVEAIDLAEFPYKKVTRKDDVAAMMSK